MHLQNTFDLFVIVSCAKSLITNKRACSCLLLGEKIKTSSNNCEVYSSTDKSCAQF